MHIDHNIKKIYSYDFMWLTSGKITNKRMDVVCCRF